MYREVTSRDGSDDFWSKDDDSSCRRQTPEESQQGSVTVSHGDSMSKISAPAGQHYGRGEGTDGRKAKSKGGWQRGSVDGCSREQKTRGLR